MKIKSIDELIKEIKSVMPNAEVVLNMRDITGKYKGNEFKIVFTPNKYTSIVVDESGAFIIDLLSEVLTAASNDNSPVLSYDGVKPNSKREHHLIWSTLEPKDLLYNEMLFNRVMPLSKLQTKIINIKLYNSETKKMDYVSEEEVEQLFTSCGVSETIARLANGANLNDFFDTAKDISKKVVNGATAAANVATTVVVGMLGGKEKVDQTIADGKNLVVGAYNKAKTGVETFLGEVAVKIDGLNSDKEGTPEANIETVEEVAKPVAEPAVNQVKISGLYPGSLKDIVDHIDTLDETELFLLLKEVRERKRDCLPRIVASNNSLEEIENLREINYAEEYLIYQTKRFGVDVPEPEKDKKISGANESFISWYAYFVDHFSKLTIAQIDDFNFKRSVKSDISMYKPEMSWRNYQNIIDMKLSAYKKN